MSDEYVIITDSTSDLPQKTADDLGLVIIPYIFIIEGKEYYNYLDHRALSSEAFYDAVKAGKSPTTSLVTQERYTEIFEPILREGKDILYMCLSSGLSSSFSQCVLAAEALLVKYPQRKLVVIDSLCASMGQGLLAYYAVQAQREGKGLDENAAYVRALIPKIIHWVRADDLHHLRRGGRVSGAAAFMGTMLNIKPIIHVNDEGRLIPVAKIRGRGKSLEYMVSQMEQTCLNDPQHPQVFISHSQAPDDAQELADLINKRMGARECLISDIGPVIGAHTGTGTVTLFYVGGTRVVKQV